MKTPCVHYEKVEDIQFQGEFFRLGTCQKCGQVKWYDTINWLGPPMVIKAGDLDSKQKKERAGMAKLKFREKKELLRLGPEKFIEVYHYSPRAKSALSQSYNKLLAKKAAKQVPPGPRGLPPLLSAAISVLPVPTKELDEEVRKHIKDHFCNVIDVLYGKQVLVCHGQRSAQGG